MTGEELLEALQAAGVRHAAGVPCSYYGNFFSAAEADDRFEYVPAPHEGLAVSLAAGWALSGKLSAVLLQNSGLGNAVNPLTSLVVTYRLPLLLFVSGRGWGHKDEPQHQVMGENLERFLDACAVPYSVCPAEPEAMKSAIAEAAAQAAKSCGPRALIVPKNTFTKATAKAPAANGRPSRREVIAALSPLLGDRALVTTTGFTSRDAYAVGDRPRNFYMQGSMGHASSIGLGLAMAGHPAVVLDGDGAALMHASALSMIAQATSAPLCHVILENGVYESTGNQAVWTNRPDFAAMARAAGYREVLRVRQGAELGEAFRRALSSSGPSCVVVEVRVDADAGPAPRITEGLQPHELASRLRESLCSPTPEPSLGSGKR